ncbi:uncharacterized protein TRIADDRAFT_23147 [Trichoplax adhaerens]|uniref:phosphatidylinositol N-acetylglucosaminyltransferase n=1 Tax=Trichoplax adhaerens TaxID=10228 RepID=B3RRW3_TRIAD|nr:hypothetical protein TRIADDRAFT_23147 [Trichoplax adhaerens]EDV26940.1 hypothetical protein TRIADDRAFT_23147 [Trichoplax adhaerens]|eukprot:XP_002110936.1 hypothetical protein TRIADDRAFT_23147 [Trichoplax adhaerens]
MVCDFFYPNIGGVENHIFQLSQCLIERGHKVVVVTHSYGNRTGIRHMTNFLKVYYLPMKVFWLQSTMPTIFTTLPILRCIFIREQITLVHGHGTCSALCNDAILHANTLGIKTVFTEHSLFGFANLGAIVTNKFLEFTLTNINHIICVSHTSRENTVLRAKIRPEMVSVIPNAVDASSFKPDPSKKQKDKITIIVMSRLVYRKGIDLLAKILIKICRQYSDIYFIIGGDGPKKVLLEEICEAYKLYDQVRLLGPVNHEDVRDVLIQGDIFLNTSLTEAFCIAIIEAASCGLQIVSTNVGGLPEVLPDDMIYLAEPRVESLVNMIGKAIDDKNNGITLSPHECHDRVKNMYNWRNIAKRTERVYKLAFDMPHSDIYQRMERYLARGPVAGLIFCYVALINCLILALIEWIRPKEVKSHLFLLLACYSKITLTCF